MVLHIIIIYSVSRWSRTRQDHFNTISLFILTVSTGISFNMVFENMCLIDKYMEWDCDKVETIEKVTSVRDKEMSFI